MVIANLFVAVFPMATKGLRLVPLWNAPHSLVPFWPRKPGPFYYFSSLTCARIATKIAIVSASEPVRRIKTYSAATGYVYQYQFHEVRPTRRGLSSGAEYVYRVWANRQSGFALKVFVKRDALKKWRERTGREFTGTEEYALAKMRLFQAFDEVEGLGASPPAQLPELLVDENNLEPLLAALDL